MKTKAKDTCKRTPVRLRSNLIDRALLVGFILLIPLQTYFPTYRGASITFLYMGIVMGYLVLLRPKALLKTLMHPISLAGFVFAGVALVMEFFHNSNGYGSAIGIGFMVAGGACVAALCRDRKALLSASYAYIGASFIVGLVLILTAYGKLAMVEATNFDEASRTRVAVYGKSKRPLDNDINTLAFHASQGVVAALVLGLAAKSVSRRVIFLVLGSFMVIGTFLPMSRGGIAILMTSCAAVIYSYGIMRPKVIISIVIFLLVVLMLVPGVVLSRFDFINQEKEEFSTNTESREEILVATIDHFPEFWLTGLGQKDFFGKWGKSSGFYTHNHRRVIGAHNCYLQVMIFWGLPGLTALLAIIWKAYKFFPKKSGFDPLRLFLLGILVSVLTESFVVETFAGKEFSVALGLLIGGCLWIWPYTQKGLRPEPKVKKIKGKPINNGNSKGVPGKLMLSPG